MAMELLESFFDAFHIKLPSLDAQRDVVQQIFNNEVQSNHHSPRYEAPESEPSPQGVTENIAWNSYEDLKTIRDITWDDVADLRQAARNASPEFKDQYIAYKEAFRALGYRYDEIIEQSDEYIQKYGYPADMSQARLYELRQEYLRLRTGLIQDVLQNDPEHCRYIPTSPLCR